MSKTLIYSSLGSIILSATLLTSVFVQSCASQSDTKAGKSEATPMGETPEVDSYSGKPTTKSITNDGGILWTDSNGHIYANSKLKFTLQARDDLSDIQFIEYKLDDARSFRKYSGPFTISEEGPHKIVYRSVDRAGNREIEHVYNVTIDNTGPGVSILPAKPFIKLTDQLYTAPGNTFTIRTVDALSGIKSVEYGVNTDNLNSYSKNEAIQLTGKGTQIIRYKAIDNLQNTTAGKLRVQVDADKPTVTIVPLHGLITKGNKLYARRNTGFTVKAQDQNSGIELIMVRIDGSLEWKPYTNTIYFDTEKEHSIEARAIDAVGNKSEVVSSSFIIIN